MSKRLFTSESVTEGHPDKIADAISDAVLDSLLSQDKKSRVAVETLITTGQVHVAGEVTTDGYADVMGIVRDTVLNIGYDSSDKGFDGNSCGVSISIGQQSQDIAQGVDDAYEHRVTSAADPLDLQGAGDQGLTPEVIEYVINPILATIDLPKSDLRTLINPTGRFVIGGPMGDAGLTGRKIIVDTYGGMARHGGGAFSGKDPSKVDRSAAYAMRWVAKNVVAAGLARRCEVQVAYAIGKAQPVGVFVETFGTETVPVAKIQDAVLSVFDLRPAAIIRDLDLLRPIYSLTSAYGHFGRELPEFAWERTDRVAALQSAIK